MPIPGIITPATIGWNIVSSSCRPRKYQGALDGLGVRLTLASGCNGALTNVEKTSRNAVITNDATNSTTRRCGHMCTLSTGSARTSWIEPDLTTVSKRWVCPPGPAATGGAAVATAPAAAVTAGAVDGASVAAPPSPPARALAALLRSSRCAGMRDCASDGGAASPPPSSTSPPGAAGVSAGATSPPAFSCAFLRASSARLRRCSGISVMRRSQWSRDAAVLADAPEVDGHEDHDD